jgi:hypothetical protein
VVRHVRPLAVVRVVEVSFDSSEFVRLADTHADRAMAYLVIHTFISASTSSRDRLLASPSELPQRYVHGSSSARSVSRWFTAARDDLTMFGTECSGRHRLVSRERELCTGGHGWMWCGTRDAVMLFCRGWGSQMVEASDPGAIPPLSLHPRSRRAAIVSMLTQALRPSTGLRSYMAQRRDGR